MNNSRWTSWIFQPFETMSRGPKSQLRERGRGLRLFWWCAAVAQGLCRWAKITNPELTDAPSRSRQATISSHSFSRFIGPSNSSRTRIYQMSISFGSLALVVSYCGRAFSSQRLTTTPGSSELAMVLTETSVRIEGTHRVSPRRPHQSTYTTLGEHGDQVTSFNQNYLVYNSKFPTAKSINTSPNKTIVSNLKVRSNLATPGQCMANICSQATKTTPWRSPHRAQSRQNI